MPDRARSHELLQYFRRDNGKQGGMQLLQECQCYTIPTAAPNMLGQKRRRTHFLPIVWAAERKGQKQIDGSNHVHR